MTFQQRPDGCDHELQDHPVLLGQLERALDRRLGRRRIAERVTGDGVEQEGVRGRPAQVEYLLRVLGRRVGPAREHGGQLLHCLLRRALAQRQRGGGEAHPGARALLRIKRRERSARGRRLAGEDLRLHDPPAHLHGEHVLPREQRPRRLRGAELVERLLEPALGEAHERARVMEDRLRVELGRRLLCALDALQPLLGLVEAAEPGERGCARCVGGSDDAVGAPSVLLGDGHRLLAQPQPVRDRRPADVGRQREVAEAADLQIRPSDAARERERLLEMAAGVVQVQRPELGDAEVHQRGREMVVAASHGVGRLELQRPHRLPRGGQIAALARQPEPARCSAGGRRAAACRRAPCRPSARRAR